MYVEASEQHSSIRNRRRIWKLEILSDVDHSAPSECCCCSAFPQFSFKFICHLLFIYTHARPSVFKNIVPSERIKLSDIKWAFDIRSELCSKKTGKVIFLQRKTEKKSNHQRAAVHSPASYILQFLPSTNQNPKQDF